MRKCKGGRFYLGQGTGSVRVSIRSSVVRELLEIGSRKPLKGCRALFFVAADGVQSFRTLTPAMYRRGGTKEQLPNMLATIPAVSIDNQHRPTTTSLPLIKSRKCKRSARNTLRLILLRYTSLVHPSPVIHMTQTLPLQHHHAIVQNEQSNSRHALSILHPPIPKRSSEPET